jgi:hypothetical protein
MLQEVVYNVKARTIKTRGISSQQGTQKKSHSKLKGGGGEKEEKKKS